MDMASMMARMGGGGGEMTDPWSPSGKKAQMLAELGRVDELFREPNPFKKGDIVTPRKGANAKGRGKPMKVVSVKEFDPDNLEVGEEGNRVITSDMNVLVELRGDYCVFAVHHASYELFNK